MNKKHFQGLIIVVIASFLLGACSLFPPNYRGIVLKEPVVVPDFNLVDQFGQPFRLSEQKGKVVMLFFGYTSCPDVCPTTLANWRKVYAALGKDSAQVKFVFITVDPERDTPERLGLHVNAFNPDFIGLSGPLADLEPIYTFFSVVRDRQEVPESALGYLINHTSSSFLLDPEGQWRLRELYGSPAEDVAHDIQLLLKTNVN